MRKPSPGLRPVMETFTPSEDPLTLEITSLEAAIAHDSADIAEPEDLLVQKKQNIQILSVEMKALRRASSLRPAFAAKTEAPSPAQTPHVQPQPHPGGLRGLVGPLRGGDARAKASDATFGIK